MSDANNMTGPIKYEKSDYTWQNSVLETCPNQFKTFNKVSNSLFYNKIYNKFINNF